MVDARERFAADFLAPGDQGQRDLRQRLPALHRARPAADRPAGGRVRAQDRTATRSPTAAPARATTRCGSRRRWRRWRRSCGRSPRCAPGQMGREEEIAYAREHGIPVKGGTEVAPYSIDDNLWGRSSEGRWIEDLDHAPEDDVFQLVTRPEEAPDEAQVVTIGFEAGLPVSLDGERLGLVDLLEQAADAGMPPRRRDRRPHRGPDRRPQGARHLRGAGGGADPARPRGARAAGRDDPPEPVQAAARPEVGLPGLRRASGGSRCATTSTPTWTRSTRR